MKPVAPDAGSRLAALKAAAILLVMTCAGCSNTLHHREDAILEPLFSIQGARLLTHSDGSGGVAHDISGPFVQLIFPVAVAASFNDVYIADAGASRLYRYDRTLDAMAVMPSPRIGPATRVQAGADGSIYVLDPFASEIHRYSRSGHSLPVLHPRQTTSRYSSFAVDALTGKTYALDSAHLAIEEIQPMGQISLPFQRLEEAGPIATDGRGLFVGSARCGCIIEWIQGRQGRRFGAGKVLQPLSLALNGPNVFVLDGFDRSIGLAHEEGVEKMSAASLGLLIPESLTVANGMIFVADGAGRRVAAFRPGRHSR